MVVRWTDLLHEPYYAWAMVEFLNHYLMDNPYEILSITYHLVIIFVLVATSFIYYKTTLLQFEAHIFIS